ncbi:hypothetical protein [Halococcus sp. IIIV-5B]|uniref:hypothetical protein n=1 Tax=Halococcus sp. IIIV-5B TaxID=2321230 RepID=UPI0011C389FB|nr:hypothetical protein [Halococcus sp. IIIV-5B]
MSDRIAGIPALYLYSGSIIVYGTVILFNNLPAIRAGTSALAQQIATVAAAGMVIIGIYEAYTKNPDEYDIAGPVVGPHSALWARAGPWRWAGAEGGYAVGLWPARRAGILWRLRWRRRFTPEPVGENRAE